MERKINSHRLHVANKQRAFTGLVIPETSKYLGLALGLTFLFILALTVSVQRGWAHGGKAHTQFTALQALQKATNLYNKLLTNGKLDESWETSLVQVFIQPPGASGNKDYIVQFSKNTGTPKTVYFFLTNEGKYAGSNHTGP